VIERGFLVCADITGYTKYLDDSELDHASGVLAELLDLLLGEVRTPLNLSRVEGDAVISYAPLTDGLAPQVLVDRLEGTYVAFRRALEQFIANSTCACNACGNLPNLDLKFVMHHGEYVVQRLGGQDELVGPDVNLLFRLTKNRIREELGTTGYLALTAAAAAALDLPGYVQGLTEFAEEDASGPINLFVKDMRPVWQEHRARSIVDLSADGILFTMERTLPVPLSMAWDYLTRPATRALMFGSTNDAVETLPDGRMGRDAAYVCWHGDQRDRHPVLDWDPPHRYAFQAPIDEGVTAVGEFRLEDGGSSTRITFRSTNPRTADGPLTGAFLEMARDGLIEFFTGAFERIAGKVEEDLAVR
jgi:uncharacterized protein YndB with AHSA1/START domain